MRKSKPHEHNFASNQDDMINTRSTAVSYGMLAASAGYGIENLDRDVEPCLHEVVIKAYNLKLKKLGK